MRRATLVVDVTRSARAWAPPAAAMSRWARAALGRRGAGRELAVRIVAPRESRRLNAAWRGKDKPTNVLSFPAAALPAGTTDTGVCPLGDLVICAAVVRGEAREQGKPLTAHWAHLVVHGALHLAGYDHVQAADAARMERREIAVLRGLGIPNPYRART
ncbi:MAG TPA: rRNA maturation RNase YbeY [Steroidobacteraceae bacterium]|nr:rRNA maturation RNase YbeY [Steroidobacteraceae bacterium]HQW09790.1 rRNA maturation RNase YbeY [Steroidobacteraceae bacterium]HQX45836.1 rRNA maturation RNase YbeY [Steroidobacteraceae bacterium]HQX79916.1 rRNA maturation RNase YbeY [Steroidobacteraceae bacterium]HQZ81374.1 rRNA maturation RNase YbeY [Steroidobacteraceae bacterium]